MCHCLSFCYIRYLKYSLAFAAAVLCGKGLFNPSSGQCCVLAKGQWQRGAIEISYKQVKLNIFDSLPYAGVVA